ncbi:MAG: hypothetical protein L6R40_007137 [Gallowayella cf. fulva]|nr:MAG: hypothetical protein L6R40_007137 [Xanthomendoza cf. fulva]
MSQVATKSFRHTTLSASTWRSKDPVLRPRAAEPSNGPSAPTATWRTLIQSDGNDGSSSPRPSQTVPPIAEHGDGFTTVSHAKSNRQGYNDLRAPASTRGASRGPGRLNPPSAAAVCRAASYTPYQRPPAYSRSLVPDAESDFLHMRREANRSVRIPTEDYKLGMIIRAPLHEQDSANARRPGGGGGCSSVATNSSEATLAEHYKTESKFGTIFTKYRKMIVVALHQDHYVSIPLYTHNGRGLVNKRQPDEFVSVKDHRLGEDFVPLSRWEPLITESIREGIDVFDRKSTAHLAYPVSRRYQLPVVYEGRLRKSSYGILVSLYNMYCAVDR